MKLVRKVEKQRAVAEDTNSSKTTANSRSALPESGVIATIHQLELESLVAVLSQQLQRGRVETKLAALRWVYHLFKICQPRVKHFSYFFWPTLSYRIQNDIS